MLKQQVEHIVAFQCARIVDGFHIADDQFEAREVAGKQFGKILFTQSQAGRQRAHKNMSEQWMAEIVTAACMANDHLWQDLGLWSREYLSRLMKQNFPSLAAKNVHDMKWKKFLYKQLCEKEGINTCRAPTCEYCVDYLKCFGPEE